MTRLIGGLTLTVIALAALAFLVDEEEQPGLPDVEPPLGVTVEITDRYYQTAENPCWRIKAVAVDTRRTYTPCVSKYHFDHGPVGSVFLWTKVWKDGA